jgi:sulfoxide reductase heme-binding subunit YedZ
MTKRTLIALKSLTWIACLTPLALLVYGAIFDPVNGLGPDPTGRIEFSTGKTTLNLLAITLAITPLRKLFPRLSWLIKFRRLLGLFAFFYASIHLMAYVGLYAYFDPNTMFQDIAKRRFITAGVLAWLLLVPLAVTSTTGWIRRLGGKRWNQLHKLVYISVWLGVIHYWWQVKPGVLAPLSITLILAALFIARPVIDWWKARKNARLRTA